MTRFYQYISKTHTYNISVLCFQGSFCISISSLGEPRLLSINCVSPAPGCYRVSVTDALRARSYLYICASVSVLVFLCAISLGQVPAWMCKGLSPCVVAACVIMVLIISCLLSIIPLPWGRAPCLGCQGLALGVSSTINLHG